MDDFGLVVLVVAIFGGAILYSAMRDQAYYERCEMAGGIPMQNERTGKSICVAAPQAIEVKR